MAADLTEILPPKGLGADEQTVVFDYFSRNLVIQRNIGVSYAEIEYYHSTLGDEKKAAIRDSVITELDIWAQSLIETAWVVCDQVSKGKRPSPPLPYFIYLPLPIIRVVS